MGAYKSLYTGHEIDLAVGRILGNKYQENIDPGCYLIGETQDMPENLFQITIPGKYTIFFYYDIGPDNVEIEMPWQTLFKTTSVSPIFLQVSYEGNHHWQRLYIGAHLYYRDLDLADGSKDYNWKHIDLGVQKVDVIDHLKSERADAALSANMGRHLKSIIDNLVIGNINLADNTGLVRGFDAWSTTHAAYATRDTSKTLCSRPAFKMDASKLISLTESVVVAQSNAYCTEAIYGMTYTASAFVSNTTKDGSVFIQITFEDANHQRINGSKYEEIIQPNSETWERISVTVTNEYLNAKYVKIAFGVNRLTLAHFALPKLEWGVYATQWIPSYYDMWTEFDNANFLNEVPVNIAYDAQGKCLIENQQTIVYNDAKGEFVNEFVAVGGGGGFVQSVDPPKETQVLWYRIPRNGADSNLTLGDSYRNVYKLYRNRNVCKDGTDNADSKYFGLSDGGENAQWVKVIPPVYAQYTAEEWININDTDRAWVNVDTEDEYHPATLNYYDTTRKKWRPIGAAPAANWVFGATPPADTEKMWIQTPQFVLKFYYDGAWVPIHAIWGENIKDNPITSDIVTLTLEDGSTYPLSVDNVTTIITNGEVEYQYTTNGITYTIYYEDDIAKTKYTNEDGEITICYYEDGELIKEQTGGSTPLG